MYCISISYGVMVMITKRVQEAFDELRDDGYCWLDDGDELDAVLYLAKKNCVLVDWNERNWDEDGHLRFKVFQMGGDE